MFSGVFRSALLSTRSDLKSALQHGWLSSCRLAAAAPGAAAGGSSMITVRSKHSNTQIKRLFKYNPARIRINKKKGIAPRYEELPQRQFKKVHSFVYLPNTWTEPPGERPDYPFTVTRTKNKPFDAIGFLPVYTKYRCVRKSAAALLPAMVCAGAGTSSISSHCFQEMLSLKWKHIRFLYHLLWTPFILNYIF